MTSKETTEEAPILTRSGSMIRRRALRMALLWLSALAAACGLVTASARPSAASSKPTVVKATETDFHIALSKHSFSAGKYTFVAVNKGQVTHALEITGPGVSGAKTKNIEPGQSTRLTVTLKRGVYDVFCPVPGHKALGMNLNITVGSEAPTKSKNSHAGS